MPVLILLVQIVGNGVEGMINITNEIRSVDKTIPILIHANAGLPKYEDGKTVFPESPEMIGIFRYRIG